MTCIISLTSLSFAVMVSDRRVSRTHERQVVSIHNERANKTIIFTGTDGELSIGFTGPAYIGRLQTDDWLAYAMIGSKPAGMINTEVACQSVDDAIAAISTAMDGHADVWGKLKVLIAGFRAVEGCCIPVDLILTRPRGQAVQVDAETRHLEIRRSVRAVGTTPTDSEREAVLPLALLTDQHHEAITPADVAARLSHLVRGVAARTKGVGEHLMIVTMPLPGYTVPIECRFDLAAADPGVVFYSPWIVCSGGAVAAPKVLTGFDSFNWGGVTVIAPPDLPKPEGEVVASMEDQPNTQRPDRS